MKCHNPISKPELLIIILISACLRGRIVELSYGPFLGGGRIGFRQMAPLVMGYSNF